jgi:hypothetical protein
MMYDFILSISCIVFCGFLTLLIFISNTKLYIDNKDYQEKHKSNFIITIIVQITLFIYLLWLLYHRIIKHDYLGFIQYNKN